MAPHKLLIALAVVVAAVAGGLAVVLATWDRGGAQEEPVARGNDPIAATGVFAPRAVLFGDTVTATVDVVVDKTVVDAGDVEVKADFGTWTPVAEPRSTREDSGDTAYLRTTYVLRCLTRLCVPARDTEEIEFDPAEVSYGAVVGEGARRLTVDADGRCSSCIRAPASARTSVATFSRHRGVPTSSRSRCSRTGSRRVSSLALLVVGGIALFALAGVLVYRAIPDRKPPPEPEPEPVPVATLLEQALAFLEAPASANGAPERRRALELVADEVESWGDTALATTARSLAWSEHAPESDTTKAFAAELRNRMESLNGHAG